MKVLLLYTSAAEGEEASETMARKSTTRAPKNTLDYCILGLLRVKPRSGYDIKQAFDGSIAYIWNAGDSQIYTCLKRLQADGLVNVELVVQEGRPNKKVYSLTEKGREELDRWLAQPVPERFTKNEYLVKLFFCGEASQDVAAAHLERHRQDLLAQLAYAERGRERAARYSGPHQRTIGYQILALDYLLAALHADLALTERAIAALEAAPTNGQTSAAASLPPAASLA